MANTVSYVLKRLEELGSESVRTRNRKRGAGEAQFGVMLGDIRKVAKEVGRDHDLALELWATGNIDARLVAILTVEPKRLSLTELDTLVRSAGFVQVFDWLDSYVIRKHPDKEALRQRWMVDDDPWAARAGWSLTAQRIHKAPDGLDLSGLLDRIEAELANSAPEPQWTMNHALAAIGIHHAEHRDRAMAMGEALGIYRDYLVPKGCTSPFAPAWIAEMVRRQA